MEIIPNFKLASGGMTASFAFTMTITTTTLTMTGILSNNYVLAVLPLIPPLLLLLPLLENPLTADHSALTSQVVAYMALALLGFILTNQLVPHIKVISGIR